MKWFSMVFSLFLFVFLLLKILQKKWGSKQYCLEENLKNCEFFSKQCDFHDDFWSSSQQWDIFYISMKLWFPLVYRTLIWHQTQQNLSRRTRFVTKRHRSFAISSPFHVLQAGSFHKMYQLFVKVNTLLSGSFTQNHTFLPLQNVCVTWWNQKNTKISNLC